MRFLLIVTMLLTMTSAPRADDLTDMPEIACAQASTALEREQIGCPNRAAVTAAGPTGAAADASGRSDAWRLDKPEP